MGFGKGRDYRVAYVEDYIEDVRITIIQSVDLLNKEIDIKKKEYEEKAKEYSEGDKDIEKDISNSMSKYSSIGVLDEHRNFIRTANFCFIYSIYEKLLKFISLEYNITNKSCTKYALYEEILIIKKYLKIEKFEDDIEDLINKVNDEYRRVRVHFIHSENKDIQYLKKLLKEDPSIHINDNGIFFLGDDYIFSFLECVSKISNKIVNQVDSKQSKQ